jgi:competence protein ComEC
MHKTQILTILLIIIALTFSSCSSTTSTPTTQAPIQQPTSEIPSTQTSTPTTSPTPTITPTPSSTLPTQTLSVHFIDVGQGDSILIDLAEMEVLIDAGDRSPGVINYLSSCIDGSLEVMVATHPHADHIGGLIDVLAKYDVNDIWLNGDTATSKTYIDFMNLVNKENAAVHQAERGNTIQAGALKFNVFNPAKPPFSDANNNSIVLSLSYGDIDFLFTGDAEQEAEFAMLISSVVPVPDVEILKVGHHGSNTASSQDFIDAIKPEIAIYMAGEGNSYGHPHQETLITLDNIGAEIYGTDVHGTIIITTNGQTYDLQLEKQTAPIKPTTVTPSPTPTHTPTPIPSPTPSPIPSTAVNIKITKIYYDGQVPRVESDEYVEITNLGSEPVDLKGWVIKDISEGYPSLTFASYILQPNKSVRVYINEIHPEYGGFSFGYGNAIWSNTDPDTAALFNAQGQEVSRKSY